MNEATGPERRASADLPLRVLDLFVSALGYTLAGSLLAVPWALYRGGDAIWFREGQFIAALVLLVIGVLLLRPKRRKLYRVTESGGSRKRRTSDDAVDANDANDANDAASPEDSMEAADPPQHHRVLADLLHRAPLVPDARFSRGWRFLLAAGILGALSLGVEAAIAG